MPDHKHYEIRTVADFLGVPPDDLDDCLQDFQAWLSVMVVARLVGGDLVKGDESCFRWHNDGQHNATISLRAMVKQEQE